jgi:hypothetical protein
VYIDDIIVFAPNFEHLLNVDEVLGRIRDAGLKLKPEKCQLLETEVIFLGHVVSGNGVSPDPTNIAKIVQWQRPQNAKEVKQFVATGSYYRRFVKDYAKIVRPLTDLTKKESKFVWDAACDEALCGSCKKLPRTSLQCCYIFWSFGIIDASTVKC